MASEVISEFLILKIFPGGMPDPSSLFTLKYTQWPYQTGSGPAFHSNSLSKKGAVVILCAQNKAPLRVVIIFNGTLIKAFTVYRYYL